MIGELLTALPIAADAVVPTGIEPQTVGIIIAAVITALISGGVLGKKVSDSSRTTIDPQPLMVRMQEEFVTRREFDKLEAMTAVNAAKVEGMISQVTELMRQQQAALAKALERQNERLTATIESVARSAYEGRQRLHTKANDLGERVAALTAVVERNAAEKTTKTNHP